MSHCFNGTSPQFKRILFDIQNLEDVTATGGVKARRYMPHVQKKVTNWSMKTIVQSLS